MKIAILGKGTSAIITALTCIKRGHEVEIYYDPEKPHLIVGEATTPHIADLIKEVLDISIGDLIDEGIVSLKFGVSFDGWGVGNKFRHYFNRNRSAFHFENNVLNEYINNLLENLGVIYHQFKVENYNIDLNAQKVIINDIEYDHLICCSGWSNTDEYIKPIFESVNSALLYSKELDDNFPYTQHLATSDGWQFGLPFPERNLIKHGYLFNTKFTSIDEAKQNLSVEDIKYISWEPKYCKKMIQNPYCSYNGNRLMFLEPLQSLSLYYYAKFADNICDFLNDRNHKNYILKNQQYHEFIMFYQLGLAWHYSYGSKHNTSFWNDIKERSNQLLNIIPATRPEYFEEALFYDKKHAVFDRYGLGCFGYEDYLQVHSGMTGKKLELKDTYTNFF